MSYSLVSLHRSWEKRLCYVVVLFRLIWRLGFGWSVGDVPATGRWRKEEDIWGKEGNTQN